MTVSYAIERHDHGNVRTFYTVTRLVVDDTGIHFIEAMRFNADNLPHDACVRFAVRQVRRLRRTGRLATARKLQAVPGSNYIYG